MTYTASLTRNQHFISRVEQRLNAANPTVPPDKQRVYELRMVDRDQRRLHLTNRKGKLIRSNLSRDDLFSFDVGSHGRLRENFETLFSHYEESVGTHTSAILQKLSVANHDIKAEIIDLFAAKLVGFIRNPFSLVKVLNTFPAAAQHHPADPAVYAIYHKILTGRRPHQAYLCAQLGITDQQYEAWLRVLFMLLMPMRNGHPPFLADVIKRLFEAEGTEPYVLIHRYDNLCCLLSDRGFSFAVDHEKHLVLDFNLCFNAFARYAFLDSAAAFGDRLPQAIARGLRRGPKLVRVEYRLNDLEALDLFHRRVVEQCYQSVFCASKNPYGVNIDMFPPAPTARSSN